jgi:antitoxin component YwqK of YwqJK toxin-antitoxin module
MKLKRALSASLLFFALSVAASARQKTVEFRTGDAFKGPIQSARIEDATFSRVDGVLVEGPRQLSSVSTYTPDGKREEQESYAPDGTLRNRYVHVYDDAGNEIEMAWFDGKGDLRIRVITRPAAGERLTYNGDGSLRERSVAIKGADGTLAETRLYDGNGALKERSVNTKEGGVSTWSTYRPDGSLKKSTRHTPNYGGSHHSEEKNYAPDGTVVRRRVSDVDAAAGDLRAVEEKRGVVRQDRTRETREYDSRGNLSKVVNYVWNESAGEFEPSAVSYCTITYYR